MPEFIDRINNPEKYPFITNEDSSISTHRMAADQDKDGNWYAHPMIVQLPSGELKEYTNPQQALEDNLTSGNVLPMESKEEALAYAENGYKLGTPLKEFNPFAEQLDPAQDNSSLYTKEELLEFGVEDGSELEPKPDFTQDNSSLYTDAELFNFSDESVSPQDYITNRQAKEATPWYFRFFGLDDLYRGTKHGYYNAKDSYGGSKLAAGKIANEASSGSGNELIKDGLAIIDNAAIDKKDIGYKKSDSWEGVDGFSEALWDFVPYQIGSVLPMIAEIILVGYGTGKAFEKIGKSEKAIINKEKPKSGTRKFIEKAAGRTKFLPTAPGKVINKALEGAKLAYKVKDALVVANNAVKKFITAPAFKQRITDRVRLI